MSLPGAVSLPVLLAVRISCAVKGMSISATVLMASVMNLSSLSGLKVLSLWMVDLVSMLESPLVLKDVIRLSAISCA